MEDDGDEEDPIQLERMAAFKNVLIEACNGPRTGDIAESMAKAMVKELRKGLKEEDGMDSFIAAALMATTGLLGPAMAEQLNDQGALEEVGASWAATVEIFGDLLQQNLVERLSEITEGGK